MNSNSDSKIIKGREKDIGGFVVHRSLPTARRRQVGPFVFLDHMGPTPIDFNHALDVRPHPHIGLSTVTYLFEGRGVHRDSLGSHQVIVPGDLNWMTAGRGIVHSERSPNEDRNSRSTSVMHGVQIWVALPREQEECDPSFVHWPKETLPELSLQEGIKAKVLLGTFSGVTSPVTTPSPTLFVDILSDLGAVSVLGCMYSEVALFLIQGRASVDGVVLEPDDLIVVDDPSRIQLKMESGARVIVIGGEPFPEPRFMWWNFVSSRKERIHKAAKAWEEQRMGTVAGENEFIPLPKDPLP